MAERIVPAALGQAFREDRRNRRMDFASSVMAAVSNIASAGVGLPNRYRSQDFFGRQQQEQKPLSQREALELKARVVRDMASYAKALHKSDVTTSEKLQRQQKATDGFLDFFETILKASNPSPSAVAKINAIRELGIEKSRALGKMFPPYQQNQVNAAYLELREKFLVSETGSLLDPTSVAQLARLLANNQLLRANPNMLLAVLTYLDLDIRGDDAYGGRGLYEILEEYASGPVGDSAARAVLDAYEEAKTLVPNFGERLVAAQESVIEETMREVRGLGSQLDVGGLMNQAVEAYSQLMKGEGSITDLDRAIDATTKKVSADSKMPLDEFQTLLDQIEQPPSGNQQYRDLVAQVNEAMKKRSSNPEEWTDLAPADPETFRFIKRLWRRENRDRRQATQSQIREVEYGQSPERPDKATLAAGGGLGGEAERGDASSRGRSFVVGVDDAPPGRMKPHQKPVSLESLLRSDLAPPSTSEAPEPAAPEPTLGLEEDTIGMDEDLNVYSWTNGKWQEETEAVAAANYELSELWESDRDTAEIAMAQYQKVYLTPPTPPTPPKPEIIEVPAMTPVPTPPTSATVTGASSMTDREKRILELAEGRNTFGDVLRRRLRRRERKDGTADARP